MGFRHLQLLNVRKLPEPTLIHLLCVKQVSALGSMVLLVPTNDLLSPLFTIVGIARGFTIVAV